MGYRVWGTWTMGHMGNGDRDNGVQGYGVHGQWATWVMGYIGIIILALDLDV